MPQLSSTVKAMKIFTSVALLSTVAASSLRVDPIGERQRLIQKINAIEGLTWFAAEHPRFAGKAIGASKPLLGVDIEAYQANLAMKIASGEIEVTGETEDALPASFDSGDNWPKCKEVIDDIRDQSNWCVETSCADPSPSFPPFFPSFLPSHVSFLFAAVAVAGLSAQRRPPRIDFVLLPTAR